MDYFEDIKFVYIHKIKSHQDSGILEPRSYSLEFLREGKFILEINGRREKLSAPIVFWMRPGNRYRITPQDKTPWVHCWADFTGSRGRRIIESIQKKAPPGFVRINNAVKFCEVFDRMLEIYRHKNRAELYHAVICLERLAGLVYDSCYSVREKTRNYSAITQIASGMKLNPFREYDFPKMASRLSISYDHFRRIFKQFTGHAPHDYLLTCRMRSAAEMLRISGRQVKEIAFDCGFEDISTFSRLFKKKIGVSPSGYLKISR